MARKKWEGCRGAPLLTTEFFSIGREGEASERMQGCRSKESEGVEEFGDGRRREKRRKERGREWRKKMKRHARRKRFPLREKEEWIRGK